MLKSILTTCYLLLFFGFYSLNASPFTYNVWQLHEYDMPKLEEAITIAPEYGVNSVIFSHRLFRSVEGFLNSGDNYDPDKTPQLSELRSLYGRSDSHTRPHSSWWEDIRHLGRLCDERDIDWYLWIHELDDIPPRFLDKKGKIDLDDPALEDFLKNRYERLLEILPGTAGFVLMFHETQHMVTRNRDVTSRRSAPQRIAFLTKIIHEITTKHNKQLIIRNFFYEPIEKEYFNRALDMLPDDIVVMSKTTVHEFNPFYPPDPIHGNTGNKPHIVEIDLGFEKSFGENGAYAQVDFIRQAVHRVRDTGGAGMVGRARLGWYDRGDPELWDQPFDNIHEINLYAFSRFIEDPDVDTDEVWYSWAMKRYPDPAIPYLVSALKRTEYINHHGRYFLGWWVLKYIGGEWDNYRYYYETIVRRSRYKWTKDPADKELQNLLLNPTMGFYQRLVEEKMEVLEQTRKSVEDINLAKRYLSTGQLAQLEKGFHWLLDAAELQLEWTKAYFAMRMWMNDPLDTYLTLMENALRNLEFLDRNAGRIYGLDESTGSRYKIDQFVNEMRWRTMSDRTRSRARQEDASSLGWIRHRADVMSDWYVPEPSGNIDHMNYQWIDW
jgi:hypothetical protein